MLQGCQLGDRGADFLEQQLFLVGFQSLDGGLVQQFLGALLRILVLLDHRHQRVPPRQPLVPLAVTLDTGAVEQLHRGLANGMVAMTRLATAMQSFPRQFRVRAFLEQIPLPRVALAADLPHLLRARRHRPVIPVTGDAGGRREVALLEQHRGVITLVILVDHVGRQPVGPHQPGVAVAAAAHRRDVLGMHAALGRIRSQDVVHTMTVRATGHFLVAVTKQFLPMPTRFVACQLIGREPVRVHPANVAVTGRAGLGDRLLGFRAAKIIRRVRPFIGNRRVAPVAIDAA